MCKRQKGLRCNNMDPHRIIMHHQYTCYPLSCYCLAFKPTTPENVYQKILFCIYHQGHILNIIGKYMLHASDRPRDIHYIKVTKYNEFLGTSIWSMHQSSNYDHLLKVSYQIWSKLYLYNYMSISIKCM